MKTIATKRVVECVRRLCLDAAFILPADVRAALTASQKKEASAGGRKLLRRILDNARMAGESCVPICQDTGIAVYFVELGAGVRIFGGSLVDAIQEGTQSGYADGFLRASMVDDPLYARKNTFTNTPAILHVEIVPGDSLRITLAPKGGGSENMSKLFMLKPAEGETGVVDAAVQTVSSAGGNPCPPVIVGVGIGGTAETALLLSKKALLRTVGKHNPKKKYASLEREILKKVNALGLGPGGLGGNITALAVHVQTHACHIATLPVAVSLSCHAARHATATL
jgi:fumarate hydratase subunit alpha